MEESKSCPTHFLEYQFLCEEATCNKPLCPMCITDHPRHKVTHIEHLAARIISELKEFKGKFINPKEISPLRENFRILDETILESERILDTIQSSLIESIVGIVSKFRGEFEKERGERDELGEIMESLESIEASDQIEHKIKGLVYEIEENLGEKKFSNILQIQEAPKKIEMAINNRVQIPLLMERTARAIEGARGKLNQWRKKETVFLHKFPGNFKRDINKYLYKGGELEVKFIHPRKESVEEFKKGKSQSPEKYKGKPPPPPIPSKYIYNPQMISWTYGTPIWKRVAGKGWLSRSCSRPLPPTFIARIKINRMKDPSHNFMFGVAKHDFKKAYDYLGSKSIKDSWGFWDFGNKGHLQENRGGDLVEKESYGHYGVKFGEGDVISIIRDKTKALRYMVNYIDLGVAFTNLKGSLFLACSVGALHTQGNELEILDVQRYIE